MTAVVVVVVPVAAVALQVQQAVVVAVVVAMVLPVPALELAEYRQMVDLGLSGAAEVVVIMDTAVAQVAQAKILELLQIRC